MRRTHLLIPVAIALAALSITRLSPAQSPHHPAAGERGLTLVAGATPFAAGCYGQPTGTVSLNSVVEPQVAVDPSNPNHLVGVWQQDRWSTGGSSGVMSAVSMDQGVTWTKSFAAFSKCTGGTLERATDPWVTIGPEGTAYQVDMPFNASDLTYAIMVSRSADGGYTWSAPVTLVQKPQAGVDKPTIAADQNNSNLIYAVWTGSGSAAMSRSVNGGKSWTSPFAIYTPCNGCAAYDNNVLVLPDGSVADVFIRSQNSGPSPYAIVVSHDAGITWSTPVTIATEQFATNFVKPGPGIRSGGQAVAVDPKTGALYIAWEDGRFSGLKVDGIAFSKSTDAGKTWSTPVQVNQAPAAWAFNAGLAVANDGTIGLTYYDLRNDTPNPNSLLANYWLLQSQDGGATWHESAPAGPFDFALAPGGEAGAYFLGDYEGLAPTANGFLSFFAATTPGSAANTSSLFSNLTLHPVSRPRR